MIYINIANNLISIKMLINFVHTIIFIYYLNHKQFLILYICLIIQPTVTFNKLIFNIVILKKT